MNNAASALGKLPAAKRAKALGKKGVSNHMRELALKVHAKREPILTNPQKGATVRCG
jgi:hypothetical protein